MQELLQIPFQVQASLVSGYLGYIILKRDYRNTENIIDVWMLILVLGLPTAIALQMYDSEFAYASVIIGPIIAIMWLKLLDLRWVKFLYNHQISNRLSEGDVWKTLSAHKGVAVTQIKLFHNNGKCYCCHDTTVFNNEEFSPFTMDEDGIAFYVTHVKNEEDDNWSEIEDIQLEAEHGSIVTYFPREGIRLLEMRHKRDLLKVSQI